MKCPTPNPEPPECAAQAKVLSRAHPVATASVYKLTWPVAEAGAAWALVQDIARDAPDEFSSILAAAIGEPVGRPGVLEAIVKMLDWISRFPEASRAADFAQSIPL